MQLRSDKSQAPASQALVREARAASAAPSETSLPRDGAAPRAIQEMSDAIAVTLDGVTFHYRDRDESEVTIDRVSLTIEPGTTVALIGPSGAWKVLLSTFFGACTSPRVAKCSDLGETIRVAQIEGFIDGLPDGIDSHLGEQTDGLSGGQIQRIGVARALYTRSKLLVLDEAASALDAETEASITDSLYQLGGQVITIVVAHRLSTVQHADAVFVVDKGKLVASGKLRDLERNMPLVKKYIALMSFKS